MIPSDLPKQTLWLHEHQCHVDKYIEVACGETAEFDYGAGYGYRCLSCNAVIGSVGMPRRCFDLMQSDIVVEKLKGKK